MMRKINGEDMKFFFEQRILICWREFRPSDLVNFDNVVASAEEFMPDVIKHVIGRMNVQNGLKTLLQHFQDPLLNKQVQ